MARQVFRLAALVLLMLLILDVVYFQLQPGVTQAQTLVYLVLLAIFGGLGVLVLWSLMRRPELREPPPPTWGSPPMNPQPLAEAPDGAVVCPRGHEALPVSAAYGAGMSEHVFAKSRDGRTELVTEVELASFAHGLQPPREPELVADRPIYQRVKASYDRLYYCTYCGAAYDPDTSELIAPKLLWRYVVSHDPRPEEANRIRWPQR